jgi:hypothetical protein
MSQSQIKACLSAHGNLKASEIEALLNRPSGSLTHYLVALQAKGEVEVVEKVPGKGRGGYVFVYGLSGGE